MNFRLVAILIMGVPAFAASCESLASLSLPDTTITKVESVGAGGFAMPGGRRGQANRNSDLPAFCRVQATLKPSSDSDIKVEVWLPASGWNGKYEAVGNGGWSGAIGYAAMAEALRRGYATSSTDTGHEGGSASFALGHPEKLIDYAYRSEHEMTVKSKAIIAAFYGSGPKLSYWNGCSAGGKQALKEAQRFPADFDGIIAGAPGNNWTGRAIESMWIAQAVHKDEAGYIPPEKYPVIHNAVLEACDALDGVKDGLLQDPARCHFDPKVVQCKDADGPNCLTAPQVEAARKIYSGAINPRTRQQIFPGLEPGSELAWNVLAGPRPFGIGDDHFKYVVFKDPNWDYRTLNFDSDVALAEKTDNGLINATDPNLKPFFGHGGKLIQYHGWSDWQISPLNSVHYYQSVQETLGGASKMQDSYRLFMVPGMGHCGGGEGPNSFDMVGAIEQWVEKSAPPAEIIASRISNGKVERTRPLCPYPQVAKYKGAGSIDDAANFACALP
ncbi:MAG: tannase/feruloyl esterase family alpha/beta hydrolase [Acidobacteriia bacterium]|nr:tannase/feruloyl esterase family alpha/beta hydrolase [Terriglobia bacterium]